MQAWQGKRVVIIGAARQGTALARYLVQHGAHVVLNDNRTAEQLSDVRSQLDDLNIEWVLDEHPLSMLDNTDLVCPSGGVPLTIPLVLEARRRDIPLSNDSQVFMQAATCPVIGITGSAGKTTTTSLLGRMASAHFAHSQNGSAWMGGNIGSPLIADVDSMQAYDLAVMELSSFQLELMDISPQIAAVLNVTPNHLDRHITMEAYTAAKANILIFQQDEDVAILNRDEPGSYNLTSKVNGRLFTFGRSELETGNFGSFLRDGVIWARDADAEQRVLPLNAIELRGEHNQQNVLAACAIASVAGFSIDAMRQGVEGFSGVPHRMELVRTWRGADWYNDSIATAPERAIASIKSFEEPIILLAGGRDKQLPWEEFAEYASQRVKHFVLFGEAAELIQKALADAPTGNYHYTVTQVGGLQDAVEVAANIVQEGDVVLLAPGGTSYDEFVDFEARGNQFKQWVKAL